MERTQPPDRPTPGLCEPFVLRTAGFPFCWLAELSDPDATEAARRLVTGRAAQLARVERAKSGGSAGWFQGRVGRRVLRAARRGVVLTDQVTDGSARAVLAEIATGWTDLREMEERFTHSYAAAITRAHRHIRQRFTGDTGLRDMLFVLNSAAYPVIVHWLDTAPADPGEWRVRDRGRIDPLTRYLQRACAKNDSTGAAGPFAVGRFDRHRSGIHAEEVQPRRHVLLARWAAEEILMTLRAESQVSGGEAPRRAPGVRLVNGGVEHLELNCQQRTDDPGRAIGPLRRYTTLTQTDLRVLRLCDGHRTSDQIRSALAAGDRTGPWTNQVDASLHRLSEHRLVIRTPEIPYGVEDPLPLLVRLTERIGSPALRGLVDHCVRTVTDLAVGDLAVRQGALRALQSRFAAVTGREPERAMAGFYRDRTLVSEDTESGPGSLVLGRDLTGRVERALPLIMDTYLFVPRHRLRLTRELLADWFTRRFRARTVPAIEYLHAFARDQEALRDGFQVLDRKVEELHGRLRDAAIRAVSGPGDGLAGFQGFLTRYGMRTPVVCNVDLMLAAPPGSAPLARPSRLVVGEVHSDEEQLTHGIFAPSVERRFPGFTDEILRGYQSLLDADEILMDATLHHFNKTFTRRPLDCPEIEVADRSPVGPARCRHLADLVVQREPAGLRLVESDTGRGVRLVTVPFSSLGLTRNPMEVFGFPARRTGRLFSPRPGEHLPEIAFGDVVLSGRCWSVDPAEVRGKDAADGFLAAQRLRDRLGLPRHLFVRVPEEVKPIYVDLDSPLLVRQMFRLARCASAMRLTEMAPAPDELWLRRGGLAHTSEIRLAAFDARREQRR